MKRWYEGGWHRNPMRDSMVYCPPQEYEEGQIGEQVTIEIPRREYWQLKEWMVKNDADGVIRTDRKEDLEIIHKTLDIISNYSNREI